MKISSYLVKSKSIRITCVHSAREDPSSCGDSCFYQAFAKHLLEFGLEVKVLETTMHRDEQRWQLQLPVLHHQMQEVVRLGVIRNPDVLWKKTIQSVPFALNSMTGRENVQILTMALLMNPPP